MIKLFSKFILGAMLGILCLFSSNLKNHYYRHEIGQSVVRIFNVEESSGGTGFHIKTGSGKVYILTNKHVCGLANKDDEVIVEHNGSKHTRKVVKRFEDHDLCLVDSISPDYPTLQLASKVETGEDIIVIGHPGLRDLTLGFGEYIGLKIITLSSIVDKPSDCKTQPEFNPFAGGYVCDELFPSAAISSPIYGGNSGSPVVDIYGHVVGVVFAGNRSQVHDGFMVPLFYVKDFLKGL